MAVSVISTSSRRGSNPVCSIRSRNRSTRQVLVNSRAEALNATCSPSRSAVSCSARVITQLVRRSMRPFSSAMGMNRAGLIGPRVGWVQRTRVSTPCTTRPSRSNWGW